MLDYIRYHRKDGKLNQIGYSVGGGHVKQCSKIVISVRTVILVIVMFSANAVCRLQLT